LYLKISLTKLLAALLESLLLPKTADGDKSPDSGNPLHNGSPFGFGR